MKITDIITHQLSIDVDEPFTSSRGWVYKTKGALDVEIRTDEDITGWGDCRGPPCLVPMPPMLEYAQTFKPSQDDQSMTRLKHTKGWVDVSTGPGLGIEIARSILDRYRVA